MKYLKTFLLCIISSAMVHTAFCDESPVPQLYETLLFIDVKENSPTRIDVGSYPSNVQARLIEYQTRAGHFQSRMKRPQGSWEVQMAFEKQVSVEQGIVALISTNGIEKIATEFAQNLPLYYEWEGVSECPLNEAKFVEDYLRRKSGSPLKPYLLLFLMHRYRSAYAYLDYEEESDKRSETAEKYRQCFEASKMEKDPLVNFIAEDMERQSRLFIKTEKRP